MKKLLLCLLSVCLLCACNEEKDDPVTKIQYIVILDGVSFNIDEEAYLDLTKYFEYLETYYATLENVNEQIDKIKSILEELLSQYITNKDDVIDYEELEKAIEQMANSYQNPESGRNHFLYS